MNIEIDDNIKARLVWDGSGLRVPEEMGAPSESQLQGTDHERLSELCCRICYDSLGRGRDSAAMHEHLLDVRHWSVYEHAHLTVSIFDVDMGAAGWALLGRPGIMARMAGPVLVVTFNYRHLLDWDRWSERLSPTLVSDRLFDTLLVAAQVAAPRITSRLKPKGDALRHQVVSPVFADEKWVTLYLSGSRGMSHEQVRHRFCISQRSTRYCNEAESPWVEHPLLSKFKADEGISSIHRHELDIARIHAADRCREVYGKVVERLEGYLVGLGVDKLTARKQARGAARGDLGNALQTEMMFSASVADWKDMLGLRYNPAADAEIRCLYARVLAELKQSQFRDEFAKFESVPAPDGIGTVLETST